MAPECAGDGGAASLVSSPPERSRYKKKKMSDKRGEKNRQLGKENALIRRQNIKRKEITSVRKNTSSGKKKGVEKKNKTREAGRKKKGNVLNDKNTEGREREGVLSAPVSKGRYLNGLKTFSGKDFAILKVNHIR